MMSLLKCPDPYNCVKVLKCAETGARSCMKQLEAVWELMASLDANLKRRRLCETVGVTDELCALFRNRISYGRTLNVRAAVWSNHFQLDKNVNSSSANVPFLTLRGANCFKMSTVKAALSNRCVFSAAAWSRRSPVKTQAGTDPENPYRPYS